MARTKPSGSVVFRYAPEVSATTSQTAEDRQTNSRVERVANFLGLTFITVTVVVYALRNLGNRYFWSDEASSLYTSLGWPEVGERSRGMTEAWTASQGHIEPGLFNMLEYLWAVGAGTQIERLRALPFLFFVFYVLAILILSRFVQAPWYLGAAIVGLMFLENITPYYGVELRPHIAGLSAAAVLPLIAIWLTLRPSPLRFVGFLFGFIFFGSFQYTSYPIEIAIACVLLLAALNNRETSGKLFLLAGGALAALWLPVTFVIVRGNPLGLAGGGAIHAIPETFFPNLAFGEIASIVATNMLSPTGLPRTVFIAIVPVFWALRRLPVPTQKTDSALWTVHALWFTVTIATAISFVLAMLGFMPWILGTRWSIADVGLIALSLVGLIGIAVHLRFSRLRPVKLVVIGLVLLLTLGGSYRLATYERTPGYDWNQALQLILGGEPGKTIIDNWTYPELRYWVELSGDYDEFQDGWGRHDIQIAGPNDKAFIPDVEEFLLSTNDRMVIRSESLLPTSYALLDVDVFPIPIWGSDTAIKGSGPVLLVRR